MDTCFKKNQMLNTYNPISSHEYLLISSHENLLDAYELQNLQRQL